MKSGREILNPWVLGFQFHFKEGQINNNLEPIRLTVLELVMVLGI